MTLPSAWTRWLSAVVVAAGSLACTVIVEPVLLPCASAFPVGDMLGPDFYQHVDFNQGSASFWVEPAIDLAEANGQHTLLDLGGLSVAIDADSEAVVVSLDDTELLREEAALDARNWRAGETHLVVVRWDAASALTVNGDHLTVSIDADTVASGADYPGAPSAPASIVIGGPQARAPIPFVVERLVVMRRPMPLSTEVLFADGASDRNLALPSGSWDILLSSYSEGPPQECGTTVEAWSHPIAKSRLRTSASLMREGDGWTVGLNAIIAADDPDAIFPGYGIEIGGGAIQSELIPVGGVNAVTVAALVHNSGGTPLLTIYDDQGNWLTETYDDTPATREEPLVLVASVELPTGADAIGDIRIEVANTDLLAGSVFVHWVDVQPNLLAQPSFEVEEGVGVSDLAWEIPEGALLVEDSPSQDSYSGSMLAGVNLQSPTSPHVFTQAPDMDDYEIYVAGGFFYQERTDSQFGRPGISVSNGTLFSLYDTFDSLHKIGTRLGDEEGIEVWRHLSTVGKRLLDSNRNAHFDNVHFGNALGRTQSEFWFDNTYVLKMDRL